MADLIECERCSNYVYDEVYDEYYCIAPFDEDEIASECAMGTKGENKRCMYYIENGEYKTVQKQN